MEAFIPVGILLVIGIVVCIAIHILTTVLGPKSPYPNKGSVYECGVDPEGDARSPFTMKYYLIAVLFLLFDIEAAFFFPWALVYRDSLSLDATLLVALGVYLLFLVLALFYVYRKDYLELN